MPARIVGLMTSVAQDPVAVHDGCSILQYVEFAGVGPRHTWHHNLFGQDEADSDASSFMGRNPVVVRARPEDDVEPEELLETPDSPPADDDSTDEEAQHTVVIYSLNHPPAHGRADWTNYDRLHRSVARLMNIHRDDLQAFYMVRTNPAELEYPHTQVSLAHLHWDILPGQTYKFILLDVEFHSPRVLVQPETVREARLLPARLTRQQLLHFLGVTPYCSRLTEAQCLVWKNRELWWEQTVSHLHIEHGDYIKVALPPAAGLDPDVYTRQAAGQCYQGMNFPQINQWQGEHGFDQAASELLPLLPFAHAPVMMQSSSSVARTLDPAAPSYDPLRPWLYQLGLRCLSGGSNKPLATWYLNPRQVRRMERLRPLNLPTDPDLWFRVLLDTWKDLIDRTTSIRVLVVDAMPPRLDFHYCAAVILLQHPDPPDVAALISVHDDAAVGGPWTSHEFAAIVSGLTFHSKLLSDVALNTRCPPLDEEAECSIEVNGRDMEGAPSFSVDDADCVTVHIVFPQRRADQCFPSETPSNASSSDSAAEPPPALSGLQQVWDAAAFAWEQEERTATFFTWFLDPANRPRCVHGRAVTLGELTPEWHRSLLQAWQDWIDVGAAISIHLVSPTPWDLEPGIAGHIIILQNGNAARSAVLMTHYDSLSTAEPVHRWATFLDPTVTLTSLAIEAGYQSIHSPEHTCDAWHGSLEITPETVHQAQHGHDFAIMIVHALPAQPENDQPVLLQLSAHLTMSPPEWQPFDLQKIWQMNNMLDAAFLLPTYDVTPEIFPCPMSRAWLNLPWWQPGMHIQSLYIYYDGSFSHTADGTIAGAAAAAFALTSSGWTFAGLHSAALPFATSSYKAEVWAGILATKFALDMLNVCGFHGSHPEEIGFGYDSLSVGMQAEGSWAIKSCPTEGKMLRALRLLLDTRNTASTISWHIPSHRGEPGNEIVDTASRRAAEGYPTTDLQAVHTLLSQAVRDGSIDWVWILDNPSFCQFTPDGQALLPKQPTTNPTREVFPVQFADAEPMVERQAGVHLRLCSCNVLSLCDRPGRRDDVGLGGPARLEGLLRQLDELKITLWAFQETRLRRPHRVIDDRYMIFHTSASAQGHFGMMVGISKKLEYASGRCFQDEHVSFIAGTPRSLILRVRAPGVKHILIAAHAPHRGNSADEILAWWQTLSQEVPAKYDGWPRVLLCDANAHVGDEPCQQIGSHQPQTSDDKDHGFAEFVRSQGLWLPATFEQAHNGPGDTWRHSSGTWHRLDYVGIPTCWTPRAITSWIPSELDVSLQHEDHLPVAVDLHFDTNFSEGHAAKRQPKLHTVELSPDCLQQVPKLPWHLDVHSHTAQLQHHIVAAVRPAARQTPKRPRKPTMTAPTWNLVLAKREARNYLHDARINQRRILLTMVFRAWDNALNEEYSMEFEGLLRESDKQIALAWHTFTDYGRQVTVALRADDTAFYNRLLEEGADFLQPAQSKQLWNTVKRSLPKYRQRRMHLHPGKLERLEDEWLPHLAELEMGVPATPESLLQNFHHRRGPAPLTPLGTEDLFQIPTLLEVEAALRETQAGRSTGLDPLESAFYRTHAAQLAQLYYPLVVKIFLWQCEPIEWKGGLVHMIPKKMAPTKAEHFRGIALLQAVPKRIHAILRQKIIKTISGVRPAGQIGGFPTQQSPFGAQALRQFNATAASFHYSTCVLFVDLRQAFHRLVRESVLGVADEPAYNHVLQTLTQQGNDMAVLQAWRDLPGVLTQLGAPRALVALLQDVHSETWTTFDGASLLHTLRGTRPGSPLADVIFHIIMIHVVRKVDRWLQAEPIIQDTLEAMNVHLHSIVWSDDLAIPFSAAAPDAIVPLLKTLVSFVHRIFDQHGFALNLDKGKTSAVISFRGHGAPTMRKTYLLIEPAVLQCDVGNEEPLHLHLLAHYKHLGTQYSASGSLDLELKQRIAQARASFQQLARPLLTNKHLPLQTRVRLYKSLILSKMEYGMGSWPVLTSKQMQGLSTASMQMLKRILRWKPQDPFLTNAEILRKTKMEDERVRLAVQRLLYAQKFFSNAPEFMQHNAHMEHMHVSNSWLRGIFQDLSWLRKVLPSRVPVTWTSDLTDLIELWQTDPPTWRKLVMRAARLHCAQEDMMQEIHRRHDSAFKRLHLAGIVFNPNPLDTLQIDTPHSCMCGQSFATKRGLLAHQRRAHGIFSEERRFLSGATCPVCMRFLWSTQRLQQHLAYMPRNGAPNPCFAQLQRSGVDLEYERVDMPQLTQGLNRHDALRLLGPRIELPDPVALQCVRWETELRLLQDELRQMTVPNDPMRQGEQLGNVLALATRKWIAGHLDADTSDRKEHITDLCNTWLGILMALPEDFHEWTSHVFMHWGQTWMPDIIETLHHGELEFVLDLGFAELVGDLPCYHQTNRIERLRHWLRSAAPLPPPGPHRPIRWGPTAVGLQQAAGEVRRLYDEQADWQDELQQCKIAEMPDDPIMPVCRGPDGSSRYVIVHLFSGRRRQHDVHWWLHHFAEQFGMSVDVISMDTAIAPASGNLHPESPSWANLLRLYESQRVVATLAATPCETWSAARHQPKPEGLEGRWPRPLRSAASPYGLPELSWKEMRQLWLGTCFYLQGLEILILHMIFGGIFVSEHPGIPRDEAHASSWKTGLMRALRTHPLLKLYHLGQWRWGATTCKPTGMLALGMPFFMKEMLECSLPDVEYPEGEAIGLGADGQFKTACHKEYPAALCKGLAHAVLSEIRRRVRTGHSRLVVSSSLDPLVLNWLEEILQAGSQIRDNAQWLPDYQG